MDGVWIIDRNLVRRQIYLNMSASKGQMPSNARAFQYQFDLEIQKIKLIKAIDIPQPAFMEVVWRRGQNNITTKIKPEVKGSEEQITFNEKLSMISTCILNCDTKQFSIKESIVTVVINLAGSPKTFGSFSLNLSIALNPHSQREPIVHYLEEELTGRTKSKIFLKLSSTYLKEMVKGDQQSIGSGVASSSKYNPNNTSSFSINYEAKKYQIPSKDTYSVVSYGNSIRFSGRKDETSSVRREDSAKNEEKSQKEYNYGYYNTSSSGNGFFNRASNQYNLNRGSLNSNVPSSGIRPSRNSDSQANKSNVGEQNSRMLQEEQTKRSKLEAENTKSKVENTELKNKLSEYVRENMKLKEEVKKFGENNDSRNAEMKKENQELLSRNYVLSQEIRELKTRFDKFYSIQKEANGLREENNTLLRELRSFQQNLKKSKSDEEVLRKQLLQLRQSQSSLKNQLRENQDYRKDTEEAKKRQYEAKIRQMQRQIDYSHTNLKNLNFSIKEHQARQAAYEKQIKQREQRIQNLKDQYNSKIQTITYNKEKELRDLNDKLDQRIQESQQYYVELQQNKNDLQRAKQDKNSEWQVRQEKLTSDIERLNVVLKDANAKNQKLLREKNLIESQLRNSEYSLSKTAEKERLLEGKLQQAESSSQRQTNQLRKTLEDLEKKNRQLQDQVNNQSRKLEEAGGNQSEIDYLMKQNLQHQLELKYKNEELSRLKQIQDDYQNLRYRAQIHERNYKQIEDSLQKSQKQLKDKNRTLILESQRVRMLTQQRNSNAKAFNQMKEELEGARNIIFNGERQVKEMDQYIFQCQRKNHQLELEVQSLISKNNQVDTKKYEKEINTLETRVKELQKRNNQKLLTLENLNKNLNGANEEIKNLQIVSQERLKEIQERENIINELDQRVQALQGDKAKMEQELNISNQERKNGSKKNQMLMEELYVYKKKLEEEKGRSVSAVHIRSSQDYMKLRNLENQLQKKQEKIGKLEKELINLENQNVKLNIEIMKKLDDYTPK